MRARAGEMWPAVPPPVTKMRSGREEVVTEGEAAECAFMGLQASQKSGGSVHLPALRSGNNSGVFKPDEQALPKRNTLREDSLFCTGRKARANDERSCGSRRVGNRGFRPDANRSTRVLAAQGALDKKPRLIQARREPRFLPLKVRWNHPLWLGLSRFFKTQTRRVH